MSSASIDDGMVSQFMAFTGSSDPAIANQYLEMSGAHLETAVGLYMEHQGGAAASSSGAAASPSFFTGDDVRAPDATQTMRLMDDGHPGGMGMMGNPYMNMMGSMMQEQAYATSSAFARDVVNAAAEEDADDAMDDGIDADDDDDDSNFRGDEENDEQGNNSDEGARRQSRTPRGPSGLADMFAPPRHLMCNAGGFDGARTNAKDSKRWLLVNIQRDNEFSCHALNRDVWRDELVENLIGEGFIFWQVMDTSPEGSVYTTRYKVYDYPHVAIIDPRTGRLMWKKEGWTQQNPLTAEQFAESAMDFCSRHSFDKPPQAPRPPGSAAKASGSGLPAKRPMHEMSEDEQLQAAMRASLEDVGGGDEYEYAMDDDEDDDDVVVLDSPGKPKAVETKEEAPAPAAPAPKQPASMLEELVAFDIGGEPEKGARIQFRMPDGKRQIRKFDPSNSVRFLYAFVAQSNPEGSNGKEFVLKAGFPPKDLIGDIDESIESCSLAGEAITVRWK